MRKLISSLVLIFSVLSTGGVLDRIQTSSTAQDHVETLADKARVATPATALAAPQTISVRAVHYHTPVLHTPRVSTFECAGHVFITLSANVSSGIAALPPPAVA